MTELKVAHISLGFQLRGRSPKGVLAGCPTLTGVAAGVARTRARVNVLLASDTEATVDQDRVQYHFVPVPKPFPVGPAPRHQVRLDPLFARAQEVGADVFHVHGLVFPLQTRRLTGRFPHVPVLVQDHASRPPAGVRRAVHRWGFARIAGAAFTARDQAAPFFETRVFRTDLPVFEVVEGSSDFTPGDQGEARRATGVSGEPCLVWVGHLNSNKDPLTILEAVRIAAATLPDLRLWCCFQTAPLLDRVRSAMASDPELGRRVQLLGARAPREVELLLRAADFLVAGSRSEGSGYAVIEALACGTTPLVTDIPSFRKITKSGLAGALFPPGDARALAHAIREWSSRGRNALRQSARCHFEQELSFEAIGRQLRAVYEALVSRR